MDTDGHRRLGRNKSQNAQNFTPSPRRGATAVASFQFALDLLGLEITHES
jgi:hypothetical protein